MTIEERERFAYIGGRTNEAQLLALVEDGDEDLRSQLSQSEDLRKEVDKENECLKEELETARDEIADLEKTIEDAGVNLL